MQQNQGQNSGILQIAFGVNGDQAINKRNNTISSPNAFRHKQGPLYFENKGIIQNGSNILSQQPEARTSAKEQVQNPNYLQTPNKEKYRAPSLARRSPTSMNTYFDPDSHQLQELNQTGSNDFTSLASEKMSNLQDQTKKGKKEYIYARYNAIFSDQSHNIWREEKKTGQPSGLTPIKKENQGQLRPRIQGVVKVIPAPRDRSPEQSFHSSSSSGLSSRQCQVIEQEQNIDKVVQPVNQLEVISPSGMTTLMDPLIEDRGGNTLIDLSAISNNKENAEPNLSVGQREDESPTILQRVSSTLQGFFSFAFSPSTAEAQEGQKQIQQEEVKTPLNGTTISQCQTINKNKSQSHLSLTPISKPSDNLLQKQNSQCLRPQEVLRFQGDHMTAEERREIMRYQEIYYVGANNLSKTLKHQPQSLLKGLNLGKQGSAVNADTQSGKLFKVVKGDHIAYRYQVLEELGRGAFGLVVQCLDHKTQQKVAIKINRNDQQQMVGCRTEIEVLTLIAKDQKFNGGQKSALLAMHTQFKFRGFQCFVFDQLSANLYQELKAGRFADSPNKIRLIKSITYQLLQGLIQLKRLGILHCDLKLENIMFTNPDKSDNIQIIDFGSSSFIGNQLYTYVQSRFYRAPEIVLGNPAYDFQVDMWSVGCIIGELFCGHPIFPAFDENELLEFQAAICGNIPDYMIEDCQKYSMLFKKDFFGNVQIISSKKSRLNEITQAGDLSLGKVIFKDRYKNFSTSLSDDELKLLDFLSKCLTIDITQRITCEEAIKHEWVSEFRDQEQLYQGRNQVEQSSAFLKFDISSPLQAIFGSSSSWGPGP
ncbi:hypothetical protein FGO68_gene4196 [Halteria grandinella]|uniref:dual-specificity kinase n=1 Tax=Halteria grandinella TaxID=5974 RepID=A0A8J8P174_HALGN|nr:hypothetical protein FGO68_gene4196 [Halteria grandinella]